MIQTLAPEYPVRLLCALWGLSPSSYYYHAAERDELSLLVQIEEVLLAFPTYGYRRVAAELGRRGYPTNHKRVLRLMEEHDLIRIVRKRVHTTDSAHGLPRYPNRLKGFLIERPDQAWCAEIVCTQMTKADLFAALAGGDHITNLHVAVGNDNAVH